MKLLKQNINVAETTTREKCKNPGKWRQQIFENMIIILNFDLILLPKSYKQVYHSNVLSKYIDYAKSKIYPICISSGGHNHKSSKLLPRDAHTK